MMTKIDRMTRRRLLHGASLLTAGAAFAPAARASVDLKGKTVVFGSWGGAYQDAEKVSYCEPFASITGARVVQDGPMNPAKFRTMIEGGAPTLELQAVIEAHVRTLITRIGRPPTRAILGDALGLTP